MAGPEDDGDDDIPTRSRPSLMAQLKAEAFKLRNIVLVLLVAQTTSIVLLMRYSRTMEREPGAGPAYKSTVAVFMAELFKLPVCLCMTVRVCGGLSEAARVLKAEVLDNMSDTFKCAVPAVAYTLQNNLLFIALANLDAPTYQVTYQTKTLFTALFSRFLLGRQLATSQWVALLLLTIGMVLVSDLSGGAKAAQQTSAQLVGLVAVLGAALLSSSSSVYFEKMLKKPGGAGGVPEAGLWVRNIQLGSFAMPLAGLGMVVQDFAFLRDYGPLQGFDGVVWGIVLLNGCGGLLVAATMKYADNIVKCFAAALAIVSGTLLSIPCFDFAPSRLFAVGACFTVLATVIYSWAPKEIPSWVPILGKAVQTRRSDVALETLRDLLEDPKDEREDAPLVDGDGGEDSERRLDRAA